MGSLLEILMLKHRHARLPAIGIHLLQFLHREALNRPLYHRHNILMCLQIVPERRQPYHLQGARRFKRPMNMVVLAGSLGLVEVRGHAAVRD